MFLVEIMQILSYTLCGGVHSHYSFNLPFWSFGVKFRLLHYIKDSVFPGP
jgi:hypothetical protein